MSYTRKKSGFSKANEKGVDTSGTPNGMNQQAKAVVDMLIADLDKGVIPWRMPWKTGGVGSSLPTKADGKPFSGFNLITLIAFQFSRGFECPIWLTYNQAQEAGGQVKKGAKSVPAILYKTKVTESEGEEDKVLKFLKTYRVFNVEEIEGLPEAYYAAPEPKRPATPDEIHEFIAACNPSVIIHGDSAYYNPLKDEIVMPARERFFMANEFEMTLLHELGHWSGAEHRCNRNLSLKTHTERAYEELVAEFISVFLGLHLGFPVMETTFENHKSYLRSWVHNFQDKQQTFLKAAAQAQKAVDYLVNLAQPQMTTTHDDIDLAA